MGTLIFLLIFFFVLLPLGRIAWAVWRQYRLMKRHMRDAEAFREAFSQGAYGGGAARGKKRPEPSVRKKKIGRDVGEYVAFEEVRVFQTDTDGNSTETDAIKSEQQIEDADWEEIR